MRQSPPISPQPPPPPPLPVIVMFFFFLYAMALISPRTLGFVPEHVWPMLSVAVPLVVMLAPGGCGIRHKSADHPQALVVEIGKVLCSPFSETSVR